MLIDLNNLDQMVNFEANDMNLVRRRLVVKNRSQINATLSCKSKIIKISKTK